MNISSELNVQSSPGFLYMLPMAVVWPSFGGVVICYIFPVLWMILYLHNAHKLRLSSVDVAARLRQRGSHTAVGLACVWHPLQAADTWENVSWWQHQGGVCGVWMHCFFVWDTSYKKFLYCDIASNFWWVRLLLLLPFVYQQVYSRVRYCGGGFLWNLGNKWSMNQRALKTGCATTKFCPVMRMNMDGQINWLDFYWIVITIILYFVLIKCN